MRLNHQIHLSNLDKIFWEKEGITKGNVIDYYLKIAPLILPHLKKRPMVLNRHPNGITGESFFQKQAPKETPAWVNTAKIEHAERDVDYILVDDVETLLYVANLGCIELNPFHSHVPKLLQPDYMIIDLDPEDVHFDLVIEVCLKIHELLDKIGADNYCKTSGGRGLHIYVPLNAKYSFDQSQNFAHLIGALMEAHFPQLVSLERLPKNRQKKIYIDYLRNSSHQTVASVYCIRPKEHAPVSTPLLWEELKSGLKPADFNIFTMPLRLKMGDIFKPVLGKGIDLKGCLEALAKL
jgi:bifunctional non-homologous end joining protein LigD